MHVVENENLSPRLRLATLDEVTSLLLEHRGVGVANGDRLVVEEAFGIRIVLLQKNCAGLLLQPPLANAAISFSTHHGALPVLALGIPYSFAPSPPADTLLGISRLRNKSATCKRGDECERRRRNDPGMSVLSDDGFPGGRKGRGKANVER